MIPTDFGKKRPSSAAIITVKNSLSSTTQYNITSHELLVSTTCSELPRSVSHCVITMLGNIRWWNKIMRNNGESNLIGSFHICFLWALQNVNNRWYVCYFRQGNCQTGFCLWVQLLVNTPFEFILIRTKTIVTKLLECLKESVATDKCHEYCDNFLNYRINWPFHN